MEPLRIKLTYSELQLIGAYCHEAEKRASHPQAKEELIVLAEYCPVIERRLVAAFRRDRRKAYPYALPVSIGRIIMLPVKPEAGEEPGNTFFVHILN